MNENIKENDNHSQWFAIKTPQDFKAEGVLKDKCDEIFFPKETVIGPGKRPRQKAVIPHVLFIKTTHDNALALEDLGRKHPEQNIPFWIYRYPADKRIQIIPQSSIELLRLLTADDSTQCRIYTGHEFKEKELVRVTDGIYKGYQGYVQRVKKNKHVIVKIEGVCMVILPYIHPDLLQPITAETN
ncbi:MAG: hypothetical protein K2M19_00825 [Muribaculaceae bacterium]|nr:hypothetical protein [Muribaculaceae bacterium]